ncbi:MAG: hypothetical protein MJZ97_10925 [Bacteroidales bacterium]|nr:hypothetical protein [Bacteroidales bacterium]
MTEANIILKRFLLWTDDALKGGLLRKAYKTIRRLNFTGIDENTRGKMLSNIITYAKTHTTFYQQVDGTCLKDFPVINKAIVRQDYSAFRIPESDIPGQNGKPLKVHYTSGSTGIPFKVFQDRVSHIRNIATLKYYNDLIGFHSCVPMMKISIRESPDETNGTYIYDRKNNIWYANLTSLSEATLEELVGKINSEGIRFIRSYMTIIDDLTRYVIDHKVSLTSSPCFISIGELLSEPLRHRIVDQMHLHIVSQYANEENGVIGQADIDGPGDLITLNLANHIIEVLKLDSDEPATDGEAGRVVLTDLTNHAMPMIRYDIGDLATVEESAPDGTPLKLRLHQCRVCDIIHRTDGTPGTMTIPPEIWSKPGLRQLQFIQTGVKSYTLKVNTAMPEAFSSNDTTLFRDILGEDAEVAIDFTDEIPVVCAGKRKMIIQKCPTYVRQP